MQGWWREWPLGDPLLRWHMCFPLPAHSLVLSQPPVSNLPVRALTPSTEKQRRWVERIGWVHVLFSTPLSVIGRALAWGGSGALPGPFRQAKWEEADGGRVRKADVTLNPHQMSPRFCVSVMHPILNLEQLKQ